MDIKKEYERWLANATADADVVTELKTLDDAKIEDRQRIFVPCQRRVNIAACAGRWNRLGHG